MTARCPSTSGLTKGRRLFIKSSRIRTPAQKPSASAKEFCGAPRSRSRPPRNNRGAGLTLAAGFERVLRNHASRYFHLHLSSAVHAARWAAASCVHVDFAQSKSFVLG